MNNFIPDELILENYIQNKLNDFETQEVELWLVNHPEVLKDLELAVMFKQGIVQSSVFSMKSSAQHWWNLTWGKPVLAVSFVVVFALLFSRSLLIPPTKISTPSVYMLSQNRGVDEKTVMTNNRDLLIQIPVDYLSEDKYSVLILNGKNFRHLITKVKADDDIVSVFIPQGLLDVGVYSLTITNENSKLHSQYTLEIK